MKQYIVSYPPGTTLIDCAVKDNCDLANELVEGLLEGLSVHYPNTFIVQVVDRPDITESEETN